MLFLSIASENTGTGSKFRSGAERSKEIYGLRYFVIKIFMQMKESANTEREM